MLVEKEMGQMHKNEIWIPISIFPNILIGQSWIEVIGTKWALHLANKKDGLARQNDLP